MNTNQNPSPVSSPVAVLEDRLRDAAPDSSNDNSSHRGIPDTTPMAGRAEVVATIQFTLRVHRVPSQEMPDAVADVQMRSIALARRGAMPGTLQQWKALARSVATRWAQNRRRQARDRRKYNTGLCEDPDVYMSPTLHWEHRDPVDTKSYLTILKELFDAGQMPEQGQDILQDAADEVPAGDTAQEIGISEPAVRKRLFRMRAKFNARLAAIGMIAVLMLMVRVLFAPATDVTAAAPPASSTDTATADGSANTAAADGGAPAPDGGNRPTEQKIDRNPRDEIAP
jgi:DNA-directed RNA polymerase specialized sigma24 family protein